jgi:hypothetical protein
MATTMKTSALDVDLDGLRQLVERRGKSFALLELVQNAWDEPGVTTVSVSMRYLDRARVQLVIEDDAPNGFADLAHAYTLFAPSAKKANAEQRGRFNLGEKLVIALCSTFTVDTTSGSVEIDVVSNTRKRSTRKRRARGSAINAILRMTRDEMADAMTAFRTLIRPAGIVTTLNGEELRRREPIATFEATLASEIAGEDGYLRQTRRKTFVDIIEPLPGETPSLYEMGIPVVETGDRWHVDVRQKVPLNVDRDNVPPAFLRDVRALTLNAMAARLTDEAAAATWVTEALSDELVDGEAVRTVLDKRFGEQRVSFDMSDREANRSAIAKDFTVIPPNALPAAAWDNARRFEAVAPAGRVFPSPKPFSPDGTPLKVIDPSDYTDELRTFAEEVASLHRQLVGRAISVVLTNDPGWGFRGAYGGGQIILNVLRLQPSLDNVTTVSTFIHEMGHHYGAHLTHEFDGGMADVAARWVVALREELERAAR